MIPATPDVKRPDPEGRAVSIPAVPFSGSHENLLVSGHPESVETILNEDGILSDVFRRLPDGTVLPRDMSAILDSHFPGTASVPHLPIVPGVALKRLVRRGSGADLYHHWTDDFAWKSHFLLPVVPDGTGLRLEYDGHDRLFLVGSDGKTYARFDRTRAAFGDSAAADGVCDLRFRNFHDKFHNAIHGLRPSHADSGLLLHGHAFRFVHAADKLYGIGDTVIFGGYFDIPPHCPFINSEHEVATEIVEESVAQMFSLAYAKYKEFPPFFDELGRDNPKSQALLFKSSVSEAGKGGIISHDRLSAAMQILKEDKRDVSFFYEAWDSTGRVVLSGEIEASVIPFRVLRKMAGGR